MRVLPFGDGSESPLETEVSMNFVRSTWAVPMPRTAGKTHEQRREASRTRRRAGSGGPISWEVLKPIVAYVGLVSLLAVGSLGTL